MLILSSAALVLFALVLLLTLQLRHGIPPDPKLLDNAVPLATRLLDAVGEGDAAILEAVGGPAGLREIRLTIRTMGAYARLHRDDHPDTRKLLWASWWAFLFLGWTAWLAMKLRPRLPVPVISVESLARNLTSMSCMVDAIQSMYNYV